MEMLIAKDGKGQLHIYMITEMLTFIETGRNKGKHAVLSEVLTVRRKRSTENWRTGWKNLQLQTGWFMKASL